MRGPVPRVEVRVTANNPFVCIPLTLKTLHLKKMTKKKRRKTNGVISTFAGNGTGSYSGDTGAASSAALNHPVAVAVGSGKIYIADAYNNRVRSVLISTQIISTFAGTGSIGNSGDTGVATSATLNHPSGLAVNSSGDVYIADSSNNRIRKVVFSNGIINAFAGSGTPGYSLSTPTGSQLNFTQGVAVDSSGNVYIADTNNNHVEKVASGTITAII